MERADASARATPPSWSLAPGRAEELGFAVLRVWDVPLRNPNGADVGPVYDPRRSTGSDGWAGRGIRRVP
ncbi:MAG: hypothetical protein JWO38_7868 [Gemmataceae bacterium]|nr:hypothetical protein [Gemmataceae bacterium]